MKKNWKPNNKKEIVWSNIKNKRKFRKNRIQEKELNQEFYEEFTKLYPTR